MTWGVSPWLLLSVLLGAGIDAGAPTEAPGPGPLVELDGGTAADGGADAEPPEEAEGDAELGERPAPEALPEPIPRRALELTTIYALSGRFASTRCEDVDDSPFERLSARLNGAPTGLLRVDTGDLLGASALGRLAVQHDAEQLAQAIATFGLSARAMGHRDLAAPRSELLTFTRALKKLGLETTLTNLRCDADRQALCDAVVSAEDPPLVLDTWQGKVAFISALSPQLLGTLSKDQAAGLTLLPPAEALAAATRRARDAGASRVVAVFDPMVGDETNDVLALARALDADSSPDLVLAHGLLDPLHTATLGAANVPFVGTRPSEAVTIALRGDNTVVLDSAPPAEPTPAVVGFARSLNRDICSRYQQPFPRGTLSHPLTRDEAAALVLDVMRESTSTEVAVINMPAISAVAPWPIDPPLSPLALLQILPFDHHPEVVRVSGAALRDFLESAAGKNHFVRGATKDGGWRINGRPLETGQDYRVVTTDFVAEAVGGLFENAAPQGTATVRDLVAEWLLRPRQGDLLTQPVDPAQRARWWFSYRLQLDLTTVSVRNPNQTVFTDTQLARGQALSVVGETEARAIGDHPSYALEHQTRLRFGVVQATSLDGTNVGVANNIDLVTARTLAFARKVFGSSKWYVPRPYFDFFLESELTRPDTRPYHHLQLLPTTGLRFELFPPFAVYVGAGVTWEVFARREQLNPNVPPAAAVLVAGWQLRPTRVVQLGARWLEAETNFDFWVRDLGGPTQSQARARFRLLVPLFSVLSLTATYDLYFRSVRLQDPSGQWATLFGHSHDTYLGLQVAFGQSHQSFSF